MNSLNAPATHNATAFAGCPLAHWLIIAPLLAILFLQKITLPLPAVIHTVLPVLLLAGVIGLYTRCVAFSPLRLALYLLMVGGAILTQLLGNNAFSIPSLLLLLVMHAPYVLRMREGQIGHHQALGLFQIFMLVVAACGIAQFALQFMAGKEIAFFLDLRLPEIWKNSYHTLNPLGHNSTIYKSNGFFLLEASIFSQYLALAIIIELALFNRTAFLAIYALAMLLSFSGTGAVILLLAPFLLLHQRRFLLLLAGLSALGLLLVLLPLLGFDYFASRLVEFSSTGSSGYARFLAIFRILDEHVFPHISTLLFGLGAGNIENSYQALDFQAHDPTWGKLFFEYGLIGVLCYVPLMVVVFSVRHVSSFIKAALLIQFILLGGYLLTPIAHALIIPLIAWPRDKK